MQDQNVDVSAWLTNHGLTKMSRTGDDEMTTDVAEEYNSLNEVEGVENFRNPNNNRIVQVITTKRSPLFAILKFHPVSFIKVPISCIIWGKKLYLIIDEYSMISKSFLQKFVLKIKQARGRVDDEDWWED